MDQACIEKNYAGVQINDLRDNTIHLWHDEDHICCNMDLLWDEICYAEVDLIHP